jgi:flagellar motility protein MotE (MotC chaperone)
MAEENLGPAAGMDKKAAKKAEKARRKEEKRNRKLAKKEAKKNGTADEFEEESGGGKAAVVFVTLMIIVIWIAILAVLIHFDVGGFGSTVMQPILKDVPYVNKILPKTEEEETKTKEDSKYPYKTVDEAVAYIKELEKELADAKESNSENDAYVADLEAQAAQWKEYKDNEQKFEEEKAKFYKEVVFSDQAPDINEYKKYYESIDPQNAENLYKQVVEQQEKDDDMSDYVKAYSQMKPKQAAAIFDTMTDNLKLVAQILDGMDADSRAAILGKMTSDTAAKVTEIMKPSE